MVNNLQKGCFLLFFYNLDEKLVTVSGEFYEKCVLVMTGPFYNSFLMLCQQNGWKLRAGSF